MRIPFSQLRFSRDRKCRRGGCRCAATCSARTSRRSGRTGGRPRSAGRRGSGTSRGSGSGACRGASSCCPTPSRARATSGRDASNDPFNDGSRQDLRVGGDVKALLTSNLTLDATINPDFGQVEVDPATVNLSAFETFFEEKRPFFVAGSGIFDFGNCELLLLQQLQLDRVVLLAAHRPLAAGREHRVRRRRVRRRAGELDDPRRREDHRAHEQGRHRRAAERGDAARGGERRRRTTARGSKQRGGAAHQLLRRPREARTISAATSSSAASPRPSCAGSATPPLRDRLTTHAESFGGDLVLHVGQEELSAARRRRCCRTSPATRPRWSACSGRARATSSAPTAPRATTGCSATASSIRRPAGRDEHARPRELRPPGEGRRQLQLGGAVNVRTPGFEVNDISFLVARRLRAVRRATSRTTGRSRRSWYRDVVVIAGAQQRRTSTAT